MQIAEVVRNHDGARIGSVPRSGICRSGSDMDIGLKKMIIRARFYMQIKVKQRRGVCTGQFAGKFDGFRRTNGRIFAW